MRQRHVWAAAALSVMAWVGVVSSQTAPARDAQGWSATDRIKFYTTSQGSQLLPYSWYLALEQPKSPAPFNADSLARYGYLEYQDRRNNADGLPLGFVKDTGSEGEWLGLNCSACHTNEVRIGGQILRIDGAPTDADTWGFLSDLDRALAETASSQNGDKFKRFARKVAAAPGAPAAPSNDAKLYRDLKSFSEYFTKFVDSSRTDVPWGRGRLDAFGMIFNRATGIDLDNWRNTAPPNAPVSVPFLWDTHWHDVVQWNGSAPNVLAFQRLGRNVGEVLGVFARTEIKDTVLPPLFFKSSAKRLNLLELEHTLGKLRSPIWPAALSPIDGGLAKQGAALYSSYCVSCHAITPRNRALGRMKVTMTSVADVGTDPTMATNAKNRKSKSGVIEGVRMPALSRDPIPAELPSIELTLRVAIGAILAPPDWRALPGELAADERRLLSALKVDQDPNESGAGRDAGRRNLIADLREGAEQLVQQQKDKTNELKYKARPLDGIWATAPYLHNGSVANLDDLLKPARERLPKFFVGARELDPTRVGFITTRTAGASELDTSKPGNRNSGHDQYGPRDGAKTRPFSESERRALVEYLKTL
jgi:hypothetical protein